MCEVATVFWFVNTVVRVGSSGLEWVEQDVVRETESGPVATAV